MIPKISKVTFVLIIAVVLLLSDFLIWHAKIIGKIEELLRRPLQPITKSLRQKIPLINGFLNTKAILQENIQLRKENQQLTSTVNNLKLFESENDNLRLRLNIPIPDKRQLVFANIIDLQGNEQLSSFMIDQGQSSGIKEGMAVINSQNILAGIVGKVYDHSSLVLLAQNKNLIINLKIPARKTLARSQSDGTKIQLNLVTSQDEIAIDDIAVTSGFGQIPEGLPVFKITTLKDGSGGLFKKVGIVALYNVFDSDSVFVVK